LLRCEDCDFTLVPFIVSSILKEGLVMHVTHRSLIEPSEDVANVTREVGI
jgi:hypothetical protein